MKAAVLRGHDSQFSVEDVSLGELRANEILVRVVGAGMCHTDLLPRDPAIAARLGLDAVILGHEGAGVVESIGSAVSRIAVGDHVVMSFDSCGHCRSCLRGAPAYCVEFAKRNVSGCRADGSTCAFAADGSSIQSRWFAQSSFAEYAVGTERNLVVVDKSLELALLGPLGCGLQTGAGSVLNDMRLGAGQSLAVFGTGTVGLAAVMAARIAGAKDIVAVDLTDSRLDLARELGATCVLRGDLVDLAAKIVAGGPGLDFTLDTTGATAVISTAIEVLGCPGKAVLVGGGGGGVNVPANMLAGRSITFSREGSAVPQLFIPQLIDYWRSGLFPFDRLIRTYPLADINRAEQDSISGKTVKPVLLTDNQPSQEP